MYDAIIKLTCGGIFIDNECTKLTHFMGPGIFIPFPYGYNGIQAMRALDQFLIKYYGFEPGEGVPTDILERNLPDIQEIVERRDQLEQLIQDNGGPYGCPPELVEQFHEQSRRLGRKSEHTTPDG